MNKKKMMKSLLIGGVVFAGMECSYFLGKGNAVGILAKYEKYAKPSECIQIFANDKRWRSKFVAEVAQLFSKDES